MYKAIQARERAARGDMTNEDKRALRVNVLKHLIAERTRVIHVWTALSQQADSQFYADMYNECINNFSSYNENDQDELNSLLSH